MRYTNCRTRNL